MYSTVIDSHHTNIRHQVPQPTKVTMETDATRAFNVDPAETLSDHKAGRLENGSYSIPVKIESGASADPILSGYESPNFIHKKESVLNAGSDIQTGFILDPEVYLKSKFQQDLNSVTEQLDKTSIKEEKIAVCNFTFFYLYVYLFSLKVELFACMLILNYFIEFSFILF